MNHSRHTIETANMTESAARSARGFTTIELIVVIGLIIILIALILPAVNMVRSQAVMTQSMNNMRQVATYMQSYSNENREYIVPSRFDYSPDHFTHKGRVASDSGIPSDERHRGTWADILWTVNRVGSFPQATGAIGHDYSTRAPDQALYELLGPYKGNPFRSTGINTRNFVPTGSQGNPGNFGDSVAVNEAGLPGFFAANDFFDARPEEGADDGSGVGSIGNWYTTGQIRAPERSMYLVDSFAGPTIAPRPEPFDSVRDANNRTTIEVDFRRYNGVVLMLFLDGSVSVEPEWTDICDLECHPDGNCNCNDADYRNRGIRISDLTSR
jgi:type II secretory pathway pseudopilin PulG